MTISATRIFGLICTYAFCDVTFPPASIPPLHQAQPRNSFFRSEDTGFQDGSQPIVTLPVSPGPFSNPNGQNTVQLKGYFSNSVQGRKFSSFEGIPYAQPPVGKLRFRDPERQIEWKDSFDATKKGAVCIHMDPTKYYNVVGQEDCLYTNVYVPQLQGNERAEKLPVMVWIHGGAYLHGSGNFYGPSYIMDKNVILVTFNYRLGPFGFSSTGDDRIPGNIGLKDQALAINWVYHHIEAFGGDKDRITVFGQSAGAVAAHLHLMSPQTKNIIFTVISQSGTAFSHWGFPPQVANLTKRLATNFGCSPSSPDLLECLQKVPAKRMAAYQYSLFEWMEHPSLLFGPVIEHKHENAFISESPESLYRSGQVANVPFITGVLKDEGDLFSLVTYLGPLATRSFLRDLNRTLPATLIYPRDDVETTNKIKDFYLSNFQRPTLSGYEALKSLGQMLGDLFFYSGFDKAIDMHTKWTTSDVYAYFLSYHGKHGISEKFLVPANQFGVMHLDDVQYLFNCTDYFYPLSPKDKDYIMVDHLTTLWTNFATNRIPSLQSGNQEGNTDFTGETWEKFNVKKRNVLDINVRLSMQRQPYEHRLEFWKSTSYY